MVTEKLNATSGSYTLDFVVHIAHVKGILLGTEKCKCKDNVNDFC